MKYIWLFFGFLFAGIVVNKLIINGELDSLNTLWSLFGFAYYDIRNRYDKLNENKENCIKKIELIKNEIEKKLQLWENTNHKDKKYEDGLSDGSISALKCSLRIIDAVQNNMPLNPP